MLRRQQWDDDNVNNDDDDDEHDDDSCDSNNTNKMNFVSDLFAEKYCVYLMENDYVMYFLSQSNVLKAHFYFHKWVSIVLRSRKMSVRWKDVKKFVVMITPQAGGCMCAREKYGWNCQLVMNSFIPLLVMAVKTFFPC